MGRNAGRWIIGERRGDEPVQVDNASGVNVQRRQDGSQTTTITGANGEKTVHNRGADVGCCNKAVASWTGQPSLAIGSLAGLTSL